MLSKQFQHFWQSNKPLNTDEQKQNLTNQNMFSTNHKED